MSTPEPKNPPKCSACGEPLDNVEWYEEANYNWDPESGGYVESMVFGSSVGWSKCPHCAHTLGRDTDGFEEGPINYPSILAGGGLDETEFTPSYKPEETVKGDLKKFTIKQV